MAADKRTGFFSLLGILALAVTALGFLLLIVGFFIRDRGEKPTPRSSGDSAEGTGSSQRIGYKIHGRGQVKSRNARIRNQDVAFDVGDDADLDEGGADIS